MRVYQAGDLLEASCIVRDGRPVANISWYLGEYRVKVNVQRVVTSEHKLKPIYFRNVIFLLNIFLVAIFCLRLLHLMYLYIQDVHRCT